MLYASSGKAVFRRMLRKTPVNTIDTNAPAHLIP